MSDTPYIDSIIGEEPRESCPYIDEIIINIDKVLNKAMDEKEKADVQRSLVRHLEIVRGINYKLREQRNQCCEMLENIKTDVDLTDYF